MTELEDLILAQEKDIRQGNHAERQPNTISLEAADPSGIHTSGSESLKFPRHLRRYTECAIHGRADIRQYVGTWSGRCGICDNERARKWSRDNKERHNANVRRWKHKNKEHVLAYEREYKRNRYHTDEEYRERVKAAHRERRRRQRAEA